MNPNQPRFSGIIAEVTDEPEGLVTSGYALEQLMQADQQMGIVQAKNRMTLEQLQDNVLKRLNNGVDSFRGRNSDANALFAHAAINNPPMQAWNPWMEQMRSAKSVKEAASLMDSIADVLTPDTEIQKKLQKILDKATDRIQNTFDVTEVCRQKPYSGPLTHLSVKPLNCEILPICQ